MTRSKNATRIEWDLALSNPPISIIKEEKEKKEKSAFLTVELKRDPQAEQSTSYKKQVPYFENGTPEEFLECKV